MADRTPFTETEILLAAMEGDHVRLRDLVEGCTDFEIDELWNSMESVVSVLEKVQASRIHNNNRK